MNKQLAAYNSFEASFTQRRILFLQSLFSNKDLYSDRCCIVVNGPVNYERLNEAFNALIERHEVLRTQFSKEESNWEQSVFDEFDYPIENHLEQKLDFDLLEEGSPKITFEPEQFPLYRVQLFALKDSSNSLIVWDKHHLISDRNSDKLLVQEWEALYQQKTLAPVENQAVDLSLWQEELLEENYGRTVQEFWLNTYADQIPLIDIPKGSFDQEDSEQTEDQYSFSIPPALSEQLTKMAKTNHLSESSFLLTAYAILLKKYCQVEDLALACYLEMQGQEVFEGVSGNFRNAIPLRLILKNQKTFLETWQSIGKLYARAEANKVVPFDALAETLKKKYNGDLVNRIFDYGFEFIDETTAPSTDWEIKNKTADFKPFKAGLFSFNVIKRKQGLEIVLHFDKEAFDWQTIKRFEHYLLTLLQAACVNSKTSIFDLEMIPQVEQDRLLYDFNNSVQPYQIDQPIHELFLQQAEKYPERIAVVYGSYQLTYQVVNELANQIAHLLLSTGLGENKFVGVHRERDQFLVPIMLGILKAGGVYVPFDKQNPSKRTLKLLNDAQVATLITDAKVLAADFDFQSLENLGQLICIEDIDEAQKTEWEEKMDLLIYGQAAIDAAPKTTPVNQVLVTDRAYMVYTSGTTGMPKGAILRHDGAINHILAECENLDLKDGFSFLQSANISSDISVWQLIAPVLKGGKTVIIDRDDLLNYENLLSILKENKVTITEFVPSFLTELLRYLELISVAKRDLPDLKCVMMTGEDVPAEIVRKWLQFYPKQLIANAYGPAEASDDIVQYKVKQSIPDSWVKVPIGRPLANLNIFILGQQQELLPLGGIGEIAVSGIGVGEGYWNQEEQTANKFIPNLFERTLGETIYRTGDLGRWDEEGLLEFYGRIDKQIKIHGFRVEKGDIEFYLQQYELIEDAVVHIKKKNKGNAVLVGYIIPTESGKEDLEVSALKAYLREHLPIYMVPDVFIVMETFPLNLSDKVDYNALPDIDNNLLSETRKYQAPVTYIEQALVNIWQQALNKEAIGVTDDFFLLGGNSLSATQVLTRIYKKLQIQIPLKELFENRTISTLAAVLEKAPKVAYKQIKPAAPASHYPLSNAQKRMWIMQQYEEQKSAYNMPAAFKIEGFVNLEKLNKTFEILIEQYEVLRTSFVSWEGEIHQKIIPFAELDFKIGYQDLLDQKNAWETTLEIAKREVDFAFDLEKGPLVKADLIRYADQAYLLIFNIHHIVTDEWSNDLLMNDWVEIYHALSQDQVPEMPALDIHYKDYAQWYNDWLKSKQSEPSRKYWLEKFIDPPAPLPLPTDFVRSDINITQGSEVTIFLDKDMMQGLESFNLENGFTLFMLFQGFVKLLLFDYTKCSDISVGSPVSGRNHQSLENQVGLFLNNLVLRNTIQEKEPFLQFLQRIKTNTLEAFEHQLYPYDLLIEDLNLERSPNRNPLYDVLVVMDTGAVASRKSGLEKDFGTYVVSEVLDLDNEVSKLDLSFFFMEEDGAFEISLEYCTDLYRRNTIEEMLQKFKTLLQFFLTKDMETISCEALLDAIKEGETFQEHADFQSDASQVLDEGF